MKHHTSPDNLPVCSADRALLISLRPPPGHAPSRQHVWLAEAPRASGGRVITLIPAGSGLEISRYQPR